MAAIKMSSITNITPTITGSNGKLRLLIKLSSCSPVTKLNYFKIPAILTNRSWEIVSFEIFCTFVFEFYDRLDFIMFCNQRDVSCSLYHFDITLIMVKWLACSPLMWWVAGSRPGRVIPKTNIKLYKLHPCLTRMC